MGRGDRVAHPRFPITLCLDEAGCWMEWRTGCKMGGETKTKAASVIVQKRCAKLFAPLRQRRVCVGPVVGSGPGGREGEEN